MRRRNGRKKMSKILIVIDNLYTGGIATALYNYLNQIHNYAECDLIVFNQESIDINRIPSDVKLIDVDKKIAILGYYQNEIKNKSFFYYIIRGIFVVLSRLFGGQMARSILFLGVKTKGDYDLAISYAQDDIGKTLTKGCNDFVLKKVCAKYKATYIHCDYENYGGYNAKQLAVYSKFDFIINVSNSCRNSFNKMFPSLSDKSITGENFVNVDDILKKSDISIEYNSSFTFVSVCRLSPEKGIQRAIKVFAKLKEKGFTDYQWVIIGDGNCRTEIEQLIKTYKLNDNIILYGEQKNPYCYLKNADAFLLASYNEAAPMVFGECQALGLPILTTKTCSAIELVQDKALGLVCENSEEGLFNMLEKVLLDKESIKKVNNENINESALQQLENLIKSIR